SRAPSTPSFPTSVSSCRLRPTGPRARRATSARCSTHIRRRFSCASRTYGCASSVRPAPRRPATTAAPTSIASCTTPLGASPSAPWGETNHDGNHVYHMIWPRDLCRVATALLDAGDPAAALRAFRHLQSRQRPDGAWFQNWNVDGSPHWTSTELDQVALPILL